VFDDLAMMANDRVAEQPVMASTLFVECLIAEPAPQRVEPTRSVKRIVPVRATTCKACPTAGTEAFAIVVRRGERGWDDRSRGSVRADAGLLVRGQRTFFRSSRVFALLADATSWPRWAGPVVAHGSWEREGIPAPGGAGAIRKLGRWPMFGREQIVAFEPPSHHAYTMVSGNPVRNYRADVTLEPDGDGTLITWSATFEPSIPGTGSLVERTYRTLIGSFARRLAAYAELH
jgi:hypothetical protein